MKNDKSFQLRQSAILLLTALIWGVAFVAQSVGMDYVEPYTFNAIRFAMGALTLLPLILVRRRTLSAPAEKKDRKTLITGGILCGVMLGIASNFQQFGIKYTTVGKAGFLTAMYIVLVPVLGIFLGRGVKLRLWLSVAVAIAGMYLLCIGAGGGGLSRGDVLCLLCAVFFSCQIMLVDHFSPLADGVMLSAVQFTAASAVSAFMMLLTESPSLSGIWQARIPILYAGIFSSGIAYTLQVIGQRGLNPTLASLIMSLESPISVAAGFLILHQAMSTRELMGCALMAVAIVIAQL